MVDTIGMANKVGAAPTYTGRQGRQLNAVAFAGATAARPLGALTGVRLGTSTTTVTATSTTWTCGPFSGLADVMVAAESGPYPFAFDGVTTGTLTPADTGFGRVDIVYVQIIDPEDGSTVPTASRGYLAGSASASPVAPSAPAGAFTIAQINVPKLGSGSPSVTWVAPVVVAAGGITPYPTKAAMPAAGALGQVALVDADPTAANNRLWYGTGAGWTHSLNGSTPFAEATGVANYSGTGGGSSAPLFWDNAVTITFPTGRFTVPPVVFVSGNAESAAVVWPWVASAPTLTSVTVAGLRIGTTPISSMSFSWRAVQMTATSAAG